jgi:hypothetical protein
VNCYECQLPGANVLSVHVYDAQLSGSARWRTVHGRCHNGYGYTYGVDFEDIADRGLGFWLGHIGGKAWAASTDYAFAFARVAAWVRVAR